jgi:hypothetical protein
MISEYKGLNYFERIKQAKLTTLETRRIRADLLEVFKNFSGPEGLDKKCFSQSTPDNLGDINGN